MYRKTSYYMNYVLSRKIDFLWDSVQCTYCTRKGQVKHQLFMGEHRDYCGTGRQGPLGSMGLLRNRQAGAPGDHVSALLAKFKFRLEVVRRVALYHEKG